MKQQLQWSIIEDIMLKLLAKQRAHIVDEHGAFLKVRLQDAKRKKMPTQEGFEKFTLGISFKGDLKIRTNDSCYLEGIVHSNKK